MPDHLDLWRRNRGRIPWRDLAPPLTGPVTGRRDGAADYAESTAGRDPERANRLLDALALVRAAAATDAPLDFGMLAGWQATVLGGPEPGFRRGPAYAKGGRERYGLAVDTPSCFAACLAEAADGTVPVAARAARVYLDVAFFHPFTDGNGRAALLAMQFVLHRDGVVLDLVAPVTVVRRADDQGGAEALVRLVHALIEGTRRRARSTR
ncbi:Fic family protein [Plantactinospora sp. GCM10030261]|uniref:Fic family protein n=1 Tax=Plantactinospora sp. GCM10030261 TaxID=3273420 RepID=UPI003622F03C